MGACSYSFDTTPSRPCAASLDSFLEWYQQSQARGVPCLSRKADLDVILYLLRAKPSLLHHYFKGTAFSVNEFLDSFYCPCKRHKSTFLLCFSQPPGKEPSRCSECNHLISHLAAWRLKKPFIRHFQCNKRFLEARRSKAYFEAIQQRRHSV